jgi:exoribonuclease R
MNSANLIIIQQPKNQDKLEALKEFLKSLNIKFEFSSSDEIPFEHQQFVLDRMKKSKEDDLLDWETIKDDFDGI